VAEGVQVFASPLRQSEQIGQNSVNEGLRDVRDRIDGLAAALLQPGDQRACIVMFSRDKRTTGAISRSRSSTARALRTDSRLKRSSSQTGASLAMGPPGGSAQNKESAPNLAQACHRLAVSLAAIALSARSLQ
jgi:hypothetical protein